MAEISISITDASGTETVTQNIGSETQFLDALWLMYGTGGARGGQSMSVSKQRFARRALRTALNELTRESRREAAVAAVPDFAAEAVEE